MIERLDTRKRPTLRDHVSDALRAAIISGELEPGVLYSAPWLSERFGVSATPVREAMLDRVRLKAELDALSAEILNAGVSLSEAEAASIRPVVVIYRTAEGREETLKAQMDTEVLPGDVVDVSVSTGASG